MRFGTVATTSSGVSEIGLDPDREYTIIHNSKDAAHSSDTNDVYLAINGATPDGSLGENKYILSNARAIIVGPGITKLAFRAANGAPTLGVSSSVKYEQYK